MKYTDEQKEQYKIPVLKVEYKKDFHQLAIQNEIEAHYPEPERYEIYESKINNQ